MSAIPPLCLLLAHALASGVRMLPDEPERLRRIAGVVAGAGLLGAWVFGTGSDRVLDPAWVGTSPIRALDGRVRARDGIALWVDPLVEQIRRASAPDERILVLGPETGLFVLSGRRGPGWADVIMPGTFLDQAEELAFLERVKAEPPALVIVPRFPFDHQQSRGVAVQAPDLFAWVKENYRSVGSPGGRFVVLEPAAGRR
jgi:hypothetical protein